MNKYKVILFSETWYVDIAIALLKGHTVQGRIEIIGCTSEHFAPFKKWHNYEYMSYTEALRNTDYDYIIACDFTHECPLKDRISQLGFPKDKIIKGRILENPCFDIDRYKKLHDDPPSIISLTCLGGVVCNDLDLPFMSPFVNLFLKCSEFFKMLEYLKLNMDTPIVQKNVTDEKIAYPIGVLDTEYNHAEIHFNHSKSFEEAQEAWNRRVARINYSNIFVMAILWSKKDVEGFLKINNYNKVGFAYTPLDHEYDDILDCNEYFNPNVKQTSKNLYWMFMHDSTHRNSKRLFPRYYDPYKLLLNEENWKLK